jgi:hypothetical protein
VKKVAFCQKLILLKGKIVKNNLDEIFKYVFVYGLALTGLCLCGEVLFLLPWTLGVGSSQTLPTLWLVFGVLSAPVAMMLCLVRPSFGHINQDVVIIKPTYPRLMRLIGHSLNWFADKVYRVKVALLAFYKKYYTFTFRMMYTSCNFLLWLVLVMMAINVFDLQSHLVLLGASVGGAMMLATACIVYGFVTDSQQPKLWRNEKLKKVVLWLLCAVWLTFIVVSIYNTWLFPVWSMISW